MLLAGFAVQSGSLRSGARQISSIHVPGDFLDLHGFSLKVLDHSVTGLTQCTVAFIEHGILRDLMAEEPHIARMILALAAIDGASQRHRQLSLGRREPIARLAYMICELHLRLGIVGLAGERSFEFPATQEDLADLLGLSVVHTNRTLQKLRATGLISWRNPEIVIHDWDGLSDLAEFDPTYLCLSSAPR